MPTTPSARNTRSNSNPCSSTSSITLADISKLIHAAKDEMISSFRDELKKVKDSLTALASRVETIESKLNQVPQGLMNQERRLDNCYREIDALKETAKKLDPETTANEIEMRLAKRNNLIISGVPELTQGSLEQRRVWDEQKVKAILLELDVQNPHMEKILRIGQNLQKERLICIKIQDFYLRQDILRKAKNLRNTTEFKHCYINPDRTPAQRAKDKELRETLKLKRKEGLDMVIKGGRLVLRDDSKSLNFH